MSASIPNKGQAGVEQDQTHAASLKSQGVFVRGVSAARRMIGDERFPSLTVEPNRYHLYVAYNCPWCHRVTLARRLLGLEDAISLSVCLYKREDENGWWQLRPDLEREALLQPYTVSKGDSADAPPSYTSRVRHIESDLACTSDTGAYYKGSKQRDEIGLIPLLYQREGLQQRSVPILFDKKEQRVVNNESAEILLMFATSLLPLAKNPLGLNLYPQGAEHAKLRAQIDEMNVFVYDAVNNGSYIAGFSSNQAVYEQAYDRYFKALERIEEVLGQTRFLCGSELTLADVRLFPTLFRHDAVYYLRFFLNKYYLSERFPNVCNWLLDVYRLPGVAEGSNLEHCIRGYFGRSGRRVVPKVPRYYAIDFASDSAQIAANAARIEKVGEVELDRKYKELQAKMTAAEEAEQKNGPKEVTIKNGADEVIINTFGATVVSWKVRGVERLFVSSLAKLDGSKAVRGGIPLVFPQFGPGAMKQHGFARVMEWRVKQKTANYALLTLGDVAGVTDAEPWNWKHKFGLEYCVTLGKNELKCELKVINKNGAKAGGKFEFTALFHNYFSVSDIGAVRVNGLRRVHAFKDKVSGTEKRFDNGDSKDDAGVEIKGETDSVYVKHVRAGGKDANKFGDVWIDDAGRKGKEGLTCVRRGHEMKDIVVWNPWAEKSKKMGDMDDDGYKKFVCVEVGSVTEETKIEVEAGETCVVSQELFVADA